MEKYIATTRPRRGAVGDAPRVFGGDLGLGFFKNGPHGNKSLLALWGVVLGVDRLNSGPCLCFLRCAGFVFHFRLLCRVECEGRDVRRRILVLRTAKGEQVNLRLLFFLCFRSDVTFLSNMFQHCVFRWQSAVDTCGDALHLFSGCVKVFFPLFEVLSVAQTTAVRVAS
jgi:hypothetical protein